MKKKTQRTLGKTLERNTEAILMRNLYIISLKFSKEFLKISLSKFSVGMLGENLPDYWKKI